jgi:ABC-type multidrug transport system fused ATPase/permease subunit
MMSIKCAGVFSSLPMRSGAIPAGQCVGIVGASGSGKSTLCALALRCYDADAGEVLVGGINVKAWSLPALRAALGYVSQDPVLLYALLMNQAAWWWRPSRKS